MPPPRRLLTYQGETLPLEVWAARVGLTSMGLRQRLFVRHWPLERALTEAPNRHGGGRGPRSFAQAVTEYLAAHPEEDPGRALP